MEFWKRLMGSSESVNQEQVTPTPNLVTTPVSPRSAPSLLDENDVIRAVANWLQANGYQVIQSLTTNQHGVDIVARMQGTEPYELHIEAKGATSSKRGTSRDGVGFSDSQQLDHISKAIYACMKAYSGQRERGWQKREVGIALPVTVFHERHISRIRPALTQFGIRVYWVKPNSDVYVE